MYKAISEGLARITRSAQENPLKIATIAFFGVVGAIAFVRNLDYWVQYLKLAVVHAVARDPKSVNLIDPKPWFVWFIFALIVACAILAALLVQSEVRRRVAERDKNERKNKAFKTLQGMMRAASRIRYQVISPAEIPLKTLVKVRLIYWIRKDFSASVYREYHIKTTDQPLHFWTIGNRATAYAEPVDYLDDINFKVNGDPGYDLVYLPTENDPLSKQVVIYFLPRIEPNEARPRKVVVTYEWPGLVRQLRELGEEDFNLTFESKELISEVLVEFYLEPGAGKNLMLELAGPHHPGASITKAEDPDRHWPGFIYRVEDSPPGKHSLTARLKDP